MAIDGTTVVVGARRADGDGEGEGDQGSVYVFVPSGIVWIQQQKLVASDATADDQFGYSVAISGETVVVGAFFDDGAAGFDQGSAYVFVRSGIVWIQQPKLEAGDAAAGDLFGHSVAISGETIVVGAPADSAPVMNQGSAYVFARSGMVWSQQPKLLAGDAAIEDQFGTSVAISGETIVVGAPETGSAQGSAYVFFVADPPPPDPPPPDNPPVITLKAPISLWPPIHLYLGPDHAPNGAERERRRGRQPH